MGSFKVRENGEGAKLELSDLKFHIDEFKARLYHSSHVFPFQVYAVKGAKRVLLFTSIV